MPAYRPGRVNGELYKFIDDLWKNGKKDW